MATLVVEDGTGLTTANSYATVAEANDYHGRRLFSAAWEQEYDDATKTTALIWATALLDQQVRWRGERTSVTQALSWPRSDVPTPENDDTIDDDTVPAWLKDAVSEFAGRLIEEDRTRLVDNQRITATSGGKGSISLGPKDKQWLAILPTSVLSIVGPYIVRGSAKLVRV